jgi:hypothetical protein
VIDLKQLEQAGRDRERRKPDEQHLWFRDPEAAGKLESLAEVIQASMQAGPRKKRNRMARDLNIQTHKEDALHWAICEIGDIWNENGGKGLGVHERKDGDKRRYSGPLARLITLLCQQLAIRPPSAHTVYRARKAQQKAEQ